MSEEGEYENGLNSQLFEEGKKAYASVREYLEKYNLPTILKEGLMKIEKDKPDNPVEALGNYLIERSKK